MHALRSRSAARGERGTAMVFVAVLLPVLALFISLGVDFAHFFDYSRNLQNRADAAALAGGVEYGAKCFGTTVDPTQLDAIGHAAQQFVGPPNSSADLPYPYADVSNYQNVPNLKAGLGADTHVIFNGAHAWDGGTATNFSEGTFCAANYPVPAPASPPQPALDVWITQANLPLFFPLVGFKPNISAHARVQLQNVGSPLSTIPVAVPDPADVPCMYAQILDQTTGNPVGPLTQLTKVSGSNPPVWSGFTGSVTIPGHQLTVQAVLPDDCTAPAGPSTTYDLPAQGGGIVFLNTYTSPTLPVSAATRRSAWLTPAGCTDATESASQAATGGSAYFFYFTVSSHCSVTLNAEVDFPAGQGTPGVAAVVDGDVRNAVAMANQGTVNGHNLWTTTVDIAPRSGRHTFALRWYQSASTVQTKCQSLGDAQKASNPCDLNGGDPVQETFAAVDDGSSPSDDSGPVVAAKIGCATGSGCPTIGGIGTDGASAGVNSFVVGSTPNLQISFTLQGLKNSGQFDPPIILRASVQSSKKTGIVECGQGSGANPTSTAITIGCPHSVAIFNGTTCVVDPSTSPWTCLHINTGNARNQIIQGFTNRIGTTSCNNWATFKATGQNNIDATTDKRAFTMVITSPNDLSNATTNPNALVHVLGFATFYVTGWDGDQTTQSGPQTIPGCASPTNKDEDYPGSGSPNNQIWGHFYKTAEVGGTGGGQPCDPTVFGDCVAALTH